MSVHGIGRVVTKDSDNMQLTSVSICILGDAAGGRVTEDSGVAESLGPRCLGHGRVSMTLTNTADAGVGGGLRAPAKPGHERALSYVCSLRDVVGGVGGVQKPEEILNSAGLQGQGWCPTCISLSLLPQTSPSSPQLQQQMWGASGGSGPAPRPQVWRGIGRPWTARGEAESSG